MYLEKRNLQNLHPGCNFTPNHMLITLQNHMKLRGVLEADQSLYIHSLNHIRCTPLSSNL